MSKIDHVLVPTDGSEGALKAAAFAGDLARALGARVSVLMVQSEELVVPNAWGAGSFPVGAPAGAMPIEDIRARLEKQVQEKELPETVAALGKLSEAPHAVALWGHAAREICSFASEQAVDLIVIGSHGRSGFARALLGSVSHSVANHAPCPVTIVR